MRVPQFSRSRFAPARAPVPIAAPRQAPVEGQLRPYAAEGLRAQAQASRTEAQGFAAVAETEARQIDRRAEDMRAVDVAFGDIASTVETIGLDIARSQAVDAVTAYSQRVNDLLHNPQGGYLSQQGLNAVGAYGSVQERINKLHDEVLGNLEGPAKRFAELDLLNRRDRAVIRAGAHFVGERRTYAVESANASIEAATNEAFFDPTATDAAVATIRNQVARIGQQEGWSAETTELEITNRVSALYAGTVNQLSARSPSAALQYLEAHRDQMRPQEVARLEQALLPAVREEAGRQIGRAIAEGVTVQAQRQFNMLQAEWGIPLAVTSAFRTPADNARVGGAEGSMHLRGKAFDISIRGWSQQQQVDFIRKAREMGFGGIGVYPGHIHIDLGDQRHWGPDHKSGSTPGWALGALATPVSVVSASDDLMTIDDLVNIEQPEIRRAAFDEIDLRNTVRAKQQEAVILDMVQTAQETIALGGDWEGQLTASQVLELGPDRMDQLREQERSLYAGHRPDPRAPAYATLYDEVMTAAENGDQEYVRLQGWRLTQSDYKLAISTARGDRDTDAGPSRATVMNNADASLRALGIMKTGKDATPRVYAAAQVQIMEWIGRNPTANQAQLDAAAQRIGTMALAEVTIDPPGPFNRERGSLDEIDVSDMNVDDMLEAARDGTLSIGSYRVPEEWAEGALREITLRLGRPPSSQEFLEFMMAEQ